MGETGGFGIQAVEGNGSGGISAGYGVLAGLSLVNAYNSASAQKAQAQFTAGQYAANAKIATAQAQTASAEGDIQAGEMAEKTKMNVASQRVSEAATGADVSSGSAMELQTDTNWQGSQNQVTIRNNAWKQAWGYGVEASNDMMQSQFASIAGNNQYNNTLLTGGMQAAQFGLQGATAYKKYNGEP